MTLLAAGAKAPDFTLMSTEGVCERALFVIFGGVVRWSYVSPIAVNPGADGILEALEGLKG